MLYCFILYRINSGGDYKFSLIQRNQRKMDLFHLDSRDSMYYIDQRVFCENCL
jgi:hypothetical protein